MARRVNRIWTRLDDEEFSLFLRLLEQSTLENSSEFVRQAVLTAQVKPPPTVELLALLREVRAQGNNINQIAKIANASGCVQPEALSEIENQHKAILAMLKTICR